MNQLYLYVALVGVAFVLYGLTRSAKAVPPREAAVQTTAAVSHKQAADQQEWKDALDEFMSELERDNGRLIDSFTDLQINTTRQLAEQQLRIQELQDLVRDLGGQVRDLQAESPPVSVPVALQPTDDSVLPVRTAEPEPAEEPQAHAAPSFVLPDKYAGVLERSRQGMTMEQIARETGIGIGEIQFVLGLSKREAR